MVGRAVKKFSSFSVRQMFNAPTLIDLRGHLDEALRLNAARNALPPGPERDEMSARKHAAHLMFLRGAIEIVKAIIA